jgi:hypothetical protein
MTIDPFWVPLVAKMAATMSVVMAAALTAERAGPFLGALIACLPVSAGPAYVLLALQADDGFIAAGALASAAAAAGTVLFLVAYVFLAPRAGALVSVAGGLLAWLALAVPVHALAWNVAGVVALNAAVFAVAFRLTRNVATDVPVARTQRRWSDLLGSAAGVGLLVATVVTLSARLGPSLTGVVALIPVSFSSFALVVHPRLGGRVAAAAMASALRGMVGFTLGLLVLHGLAVPLGAPAALIAALLTMLAWSGGLIVWRQWQLRAAQAG